VLAGRLFHGAVPTLATPFSADILLDEGVFREQVERYLDSGVREISTAGIQGEFFSLRSDWPLRPNPTLEVGHSTFVK